MAKDAYYFSHDCSARNDPKISALISEYGMEGYGFYWAFIEILSEQDNYKLKKFPKLNEGIAKQCLSDASKIRSTLEALINDYELLQEDEKYIWSNSLIRRMQEKEKKRLQKVEAGRKGGVKSGLSRNNQLENELVLKQNEAPLKQNEAPLEANEPKESKVKESKVNNKNIYGEKVFLTSWEYQKLIAQFSKVGADERINNLDLYIQSHGKEYDNHYATILYWDKKNNAASKKKTDPYQEA